MSRTDPKEWEKVKHQLNGPFLTMGKPVDPEEANAPYWWKGDEEAFAAVQGIMNRGRRRR